jgi:diguanylate cyclase (GGDEF)-like protein/PAS domain S-box-containing protein
MVHRQYRPFSDALTSWSKPAVQLLAVGLVLIAAALALIYIQDESTSGYEAALENHRLELKAYDIMSAGWRAALGNSVPPEASPDPEFARYEAVASVQALEELLADYHANWTNRGPGAVSAKLAEYVAMHDEELALIREGRGLETFPLLGSALILFEELRADARNSTQATLANAERTDTLAHIASVAVLTFAFLAVSTMALLYRRAENRLRESAAEHEILRRSDARFRPLVQSSADLIMVLDAKGVIHYASPSVERLASVPPEGAIGMSWFDFVIPEDHHFVEDFLEEITARPGYTATAELRLRTGEDLATRRYIQATCTNRLNDPDINGLVLNVRDISERKELEEQLRHQAFHDSLTGLANRLRFTDRLEHALKRAHRNGVEKVSVLYMDLDYFKNVNDDMGHTAGDALLKTVAQRITSCLRPSDTAARLGGDEFAVLLEDSRGLLDARRTAERILASINKPFYLGDREVIVSASIGVVNADADTMTAEEIIRDADVAMYDAKENGRGRVQVFEPGMQLSLVERLNLTNELNLAIERNQLLVYYQPTLNLETERIVGFEALVRWQHPTRGILPPNDFVPLAEESGFIHALGDHVLTEACRQARAWQSAFPSLADITMSVNVSARQIQRPGFVDIVRTALEASGLPPEKLVLEITESILIRHPQDAVSTLNELKKLGIQLALDDFGTGYSSLNYLKRFPIDILKIDRNFIESMDAGDRDTMLVQTVIDLGHMLKLDIIAEGIERREQLNRLRDLHCSLGQGFLFARALDAAGAAGLLQTQSDAMAASNDDAVAGEQRAVA